MDGIPKSVTDYGQSFLSATFGSLEEMWGYFKALVEQTIDNHVPTKMSMSRLTHPWVNTQIRCKMCRKQWAHGRVRSGKSSDWQRYKNLQSAAQGDIRKAHKTYMNDTVSKDLKGNPKRFWSATKSSRQEAKRVAPLINKEGFLQRDFFHWQESRNLERPIPFKLHERRHISHPEQSTKPIW